MGILSTILPNHALKHLQRAIQPPKPQQEELLHYSDTLIILKVPQDDSECAFGVLNTLVSSVQDSCPDILRCEMYGYISKHADVEIHLTLRFSSNLSAVNFQVDGLFLKDWLERWEGKGFWTCDLYHEAIKMVAGFDRGKSGRTILDPDEPTINSEQRSDGMEKTATKLETMVVHANGGVQMPEMSDVQRGKQKQ
ncbi:MAG: hypothetical protein LQ339_008426 [Xanthoria mediterranea]|nr:MAG: hypothetical protein LQ339_008426 [Xanthoria mediterranea]